MYILYIFHAKSSQTRPVEQKARTGKGSVEQQARTGKCSESVCVCVKTCAYTCQEPSACESYVKRM